MLTSQTSLCAVVLIALAAVNAGAANEPQPVIILEAKDFTPERQERRLAVAGGEITWSPSVPVTKGDRVQATFSMTEGVPINDVRVKLDNKPYAFLKSPPWQVIVDTSKLAPGPHVLVGEVRSKSKVIMYGFARLEFKVEDKPTTLVLGTVEELANGAVTTHEVTAMDPSIAVTLRSLDSEMDTTIKSGAALQISRPTTLYVDTDVKRWAYSVTRGGVEVLSGGPIDRLVYLELAPKAGNQPGLLPGELSLMVWAVKDDGTRSAPVVVPLVISKAGE